MEKVNALKVRQAFGSILRRLQRSEEPILIEKGRNPVAVLISIKTFRDRFIDYREKKKREELLARFRKLETRPQESSLNLLRELRYGADH